MMLNKQVVIIKILASLIGIVKCQQTEKFPLLMPNVQPLVPESYLCTPVKIDVENTYFIVGFEPNATMNTAHHIIIYGCSKPGSAKPLWSCGEMVNSKDSRLDEASPCADGSQIIYAWARDAPTLNLPEGVGFKVGKDSAMKYLVLQVHYAHIDRFKDGSTDDSGVKLIYTKKQLNKQAGVIVLGTGGSIPPQSLEYMETSCSITENKTIHPFAYRTHTHSLGKEVAGYVIKPDNRWIELGKRDPLTPQMFYKIHNNVNITYRDKLAARCTMQSYRDRVTYVGNTNEHEMCNFYIMYYVENDEPLENKFCFTMGPPNYYWESDNLINIPDRVAPPL